jgi:hypothetical protein
MQSVIEELIRGVGYVVRRIVTTIVESTEVSHSRRLSQWPIRLRR